DAAFERGVAFCASLAWHFHEINAALAFRTAGFETQMAPASEVIYEILRHLAAAEPAPAAGPGSEASGAKNAGRSLLDELTDLPQTFKIIITGRPRGSIPTALWSSSYILFLDGTET